VADPGAGLLAWLLARFQIENIKVLVRGLVNHIPFEEVRRFIVPLPRDLTLNSEGLQKANSLEEFIARLPPGMPRRWLRHAATVYHEQPRTFFLEAALDCGYFRELLTRTQQLRDDDKEQVKPLIFQEVDTFHLMLVLRGKFHYGLTPELLLPLHVTGSGISSERFATMSSDLDPLTAANRTLGRVLDQLPSAVETPSESQTLNLAAFEALAWKRFRRLANLCLSSQSHGPGSGRWLPGHQAS
jgi:vacuolar-type H+-ATPase subunit C/Vma6